MTIEGTALPVVDVIGRYFSQALGSLTSWKDEFASELVGAKTTGPLTAARLDDLVAPFAQRTFDSTSVPVYGTGFIAALDFLADSRSHLAWWQGPERAKLTLATQSVNKDHIDYSELEWYRVPMLTGQPHLAGPYVDYLCSDEYTITIAVPVHIGGAFVGVTGLDLLIDRVERDLSPQLSAGERDITIINGVGRIVLSTNPRRATGDSLRGGDLDGLERFACEGIALEVVIG